MSTRAMRTLSSLLIVSSVFDVASAQKYYVQCEKPTPRIRANPPYEYVKYKIGNVTQTHKRNLMGRQPPFGFAVEIPAGKSITVRHKKLESVYRPTGELVYDAVDINGCSFMMLPEKYNVECTPKKVGDGRWWIEGHTNGEFFDESYYSADKKFTLEIPDPTSFTLRIFNDWIHLPVKLKENTAEEGPCKFSAPCPEGYIAGGVRRGCVKNFTLPPCKPDGPCAMAGAPVTGPPPPGVVTGPPPPATGFKITCGKGKRVKFAKNAPEGETRIKVGKRVGKGWEKSLTTEAKKIYFRDMKKHVSWKNAKIDTKQGQRRFKQMTQCTIRSV